MASICRGLRPHCGAGTITRPSPNQDLVLLQHEISRHVLPDHRQKPITPLVTLSIQQQYVLPIFINPFPSSSLHQSAMLLSWSALPFSGERIRPVERPMLITTNNSRPGAAVMTCADWGRTLTNKHVHWKFALKVTAVLNEEFYHLKSFKRTSFARRCQSPYNHRRCVFGPTSPT